MGQSSTFLLQEVNEPSRMQKGEWGIGKGASPPSRVQGRIPYRYGRVDKGGEGALILNPQPPPCKGGALPG